jgi:hypothetical protein
MLRRVAPVTSQKTPFFIVTAVKTSILQESLCLLMFSFDIDFGNKTAANVPEFLEDMPNTWNNDCALVYYT